MDIYVVQDVISAFGGSLITSMLINKSLRKKKEKAKDPNRCTCKHNVSFHDEDGCHAQVNGGKPLKYDEWNEPTAWEQVRCGCRRFVGPNSSYDPGLDADLKRAATPLTPPTQPRISPLPPYDVPPRLPRQNDGKKKNGGR